VGTQDHEREIVTSHPHQPSEQRVFPPFSGKLRADEKLNLSDVDFKQKIDDIFNGKIVTPLSQLTATPAFPTPHVLAQFASKAYRVYKPGETDSQYETRLDLPDGWKLLTRASNGRRKNGYFGAAYWHPEHQQVVIAHRGTKPSNLGALWTDAVGVFLNKHVPQIGSASTFAHKVVEVLQEVKREKGTSFQVFFTGHSLGGWLAQITTFTTKYLNIEGNIFLKSDSIPQSYHPHTVVFDSPGCKDMLSEMTDKFDVLLDGRSIDIEHLDITSYLSAPNRINTCNKHLGTVYRIFTDLSDMGLWKKHTALYNLTTHSMRKIVEAFDPITGQVDKDEQGNLKIQVVVDWPVAAGLSRGKEYKKLFKWAKHFNNYHPQVTDESFQLKGYHPIRYQTKTYDVRECRLSIFCQQERQFLESYGSLRQLPEFFKPKELFSVMEDKQAQEQAEKLLEGFEIENDRVYCTDDSELQALIPYVKRLLELFPQLGGNTKGVLTQQQIGNNVYQFVTKRYVETLHQSPLDIKPDDSNVRDFLNSDEQKVLQLRMVDGGAWTGLIKVYQVLEKTPSMTDCLSEGHYTIVTLEHLILVNQLVNLSTVMESTTAPHLLMMSCETNQLLNVESKQILKSLFNIVRQKQDVKIICTTQSENETVTFLQDIAKETLSNGFITRDEQLTWCDLTTSSQEQLLENAVSFQGTEIALNQIVSVDSTLQNSVPLAALLEKRHLKIGEEPVSNCDCSYYDERYYIDRTFSHQVVIKHDILNDHEYKKFPDILASTEQEFEQLCQLNPKNNVHWLEKNKSGKLLWQKSQGSLEKLRSYIDTNSSHTYTPDDVDKLLEQAQHQRVVLISDTAGMGKSTVLTRLSKQIKNKFPAKWVVRIDLNDCTDALADLKREEINKEKAIEFVSERLLKLKPGFELELFKQFCEQKQKVRTVIMLDGFDEISPTYDETVIDLLQALRQTAVEQLWVTTRPHLRTKLEDKLQQLSYTLDPFSEENQVEFLKKFWSLKEWFTDVGKDAEEEFKTKLVNYAKHLIMKLSQSLSDRDKVFTGIPLQCRMLAEAFDKEVKEFCQSTEFVPELPYKLDLLGLYERCINRKYDVCLEEKFKISKTNVGVAGERKKWLKNNAEHHQKLALKMLFAEKQLDLLQINSQFTSSDEDLTRTGIVQINYEGKLHFIHRTFAEFYVADYFVNDLTKGSNISQQIQDLLLQEILREEQYRVVRVFVDGLLSRLEPSNVAIKQWGNLIHELEIYGLVTLGKTVREGNVHIIRFLFRSLEKTGETKTLVRVLLRPRLYNQIIWHEAAETSQINVLQTLWEGAKEVLTQEELSTMFFAQDMFCRTAWKMMVEKGQIDLLHKLWEWAKEALTQEELTNLILSDTNRFSWHKAIQDGQIESLHTLWEWAKEVLTHEELNDLFLYKTGYQLSAWFVAAEKGQMKVLHNWWEWAKEVLTKEELNNIFLAKDRNERTAWCRAAEKGQIEVLNKLWDWAKEILTPEELSNMLLDKDGDERTAWCRAAEKGQIEVLNKLWDWAKEILTPEELNNMFIDKDRDEMTACHMAAGEGQVEILHKMWELAKQTLTPEELKSMLLTKNRYERTAWHMASMKVQIESLHKLWELAKQVLTPEELNTMLLAKDRDEMTTWHIASEEGQIEVLQKLWECAKEVLTPEELNNMFLAKDRDERTAWHMAAEKGQLEVLHKLWDCAKEVLTSEELNKLFLDKGKNEMTAWHMAAEKGQRKILLKMLELAKQLLTQKELNNMLFLDKDRDERTTWHIALLNDQLDILRMLWQWANQVLTPEELKSMFLAKDRYERTAWDMVLQKGEIELLDQLWRWTRKVLTPEELKSMFLAKDGCERTAWHMASQKVQIELLHKLWELAKEVLTPEELKSMFLAKDGYGSTAWRMALEETEKDVLRKFREWAKEVLTQEELNKMF